MAREICNLFLRDHHLLYQVYNATKSCHNIILLDDHVLLHPLINVDPMPLMHKIGLYMSILYRPRVQHQSNEVNLTWVSINCKIERGKWSTSFVMINVLALTYWHTHKIVWVFLLIILIHIDMNGIGNTSLLCRIVANFATN